MRDSSQMPDPTPIIKKRFFISQQSIDFNDVDEDLDLASIMAKTKAVLPSSPFISKSSAIRPSQAQRVLDSDDES